MFDKPLLSWENWPVVVICIGMLAAAIIDWWKFKVPNKLTFPLIFSGWCSAWPTTSASARATAASARPSSAPCLGCALLIPVYAIGGMGAGDVKMTMGFGSWIGAFYGINTGAEIDATTHHLLGLLRRRPRRRRHRPGHDPGARPVPAKRPTPPRHPRRHVQVVRHRRDRGQGQQPPAALASVALRRSVVHRLPWLPGLYPQL